MPHLCVQWPTVGHYHLARLSALERRCETSGWRVTCLETSGADITGRDQAARNHDAPSIVTVFGNRSFESLSPRAMRAGIRDALDELSPDVVAINSYSFPDARAALRWCLDRSRGTILMTDSRKEDAERTRWRELVKRTIVSQFGAAVVAGSPQRAYVRDLGLNDEQIFDGYDVVDNAFFSDGAAAAKRLRDEARNLPGLTGPGQATPFFLSSGRMIRRKDHLTLIEGYRRYRASVSDPWRLILLGDGALRPEIERVISEEQIRGVTLAGWQPYDSLPVYYGLASGFIHTAVIDQWGLVVNEALAAGVPVIVSLGTGCVDDLVKGRGTGYTFAPGDAGELADCMVALSSDLEKRAMMSARAGEIVSEWSLDRFAESMLGASEIARSAAHGGSGLARLLLRAVDAASQDLTSFHSVES